MYKFIDNNTLKLDNSELWYTVDNNNLPYNTDLPKLTDLHYSHLIRYIPKLVDIHLNNQYDDIINMCIVIKGY